MATKKTTTKTTTTKKAPPKKTAPATKPAMQTTKRAPAKTVAPKAITSTAPTHDEIARRAYLLFEARGFEHGHDVDDWRTAEAELSRGV